MKVNGNIMGVKDSYLEILDKLYDIDVDNDEFVCEEILDTMVRMTDILRKEISVFINRRGKVVDVSVGDSTTVQLPMLDYRRGTRRLSGVRCIHTHPESSGYLSSVDISALVNLRLDLIMGIGVKDGKENDIYMGYLVPQSGALSEEHNVIGPYNRASMNNIKIADILTEIEKNINSNIPESTDDNKKERVLLVGISIPGKIESSEDLLNELEELAKTAGAEVIGRILQNRSKIDSAYYIGSGKAHELSLLKQAYDIDTIIFDDQLSAVQVRNLEDITGAKVIDRTTLILDIFASRANTREGKLQVELAQLKYNSLRLIGFGKILSRTGGGIGTRGPGEKKLEIDRRHIKERINELENNLDDVKKGRDIQREKRKSSLIQTISIVGYTNSGKSTLRNRLSDIYQSDPILKKERVVEADMLFATLDPTTRLIKLPKGHEVLISDTVGFIRKLPHDLVEAFRATLEEVTYSDMLIHVVDSSSPNAREQFDAVNSVLAQLAVHDKPTIIALNKVDKIVNYEDITSLKNGLGEVVEISALYEKGIDTLCTILEDKLFSGTKTVLFRIPYDKMGFKSSLYNEYKVISEEYNEDSAILTVIVDDTALIKYNNYIIGEIPKS